MSRKEKHKKGKSIPTPEKRANVVKAIRGLEKDVSDLKRTMSRIAYSTGTNLGVLEERLTTIHEGMATIVHILKEDFGTTEDRIEAAHKFVMDRWKADQLEDKKKELQQGQAICENCVFLALVLEFEKADLCCPKCGSVEVFFAPEPEEDQEPVKEAS